MPRASPSCSTLQPVEAEQKLAHPIESQLRKAFDTMWVTMNTYDQESRILTETLIYELTKAFALPRSERAKRIIRLIFGKAARAAAEVGIGLDRAVAEGGLRAGARWLLPRFVKTHSACGVENIPASGPLVIASNHPASVDSVVISAHVSRPDYKAIIGDIPFFEHLPHVSECAIFAPMPII